MIDVIREQIRAELESAWWLSERGLNRASSTENANYYDEVFREWMNKPDAERPIEYYVADVLRSCTFGLLEDFTEDPRLLLRMLSMINYDIGWLSYLFDIKKDPSMILDEIPPSVLSSRLAKLAHADTYMYRKEAIDYWHQHIDPNLSAQKAANILMKYTPLSHKKLAEYISAEKRRLKEEETKT